MIHFTFDAMGTVIEVWGSEDQRAQVEAWFELVESTASRFRPESELSAINGGPGGTSTLLSEVLADALHAADRARQITSGLVDIGVGGAVDAWGYNRTFREVSDLEQAPDPVRAGDWEIRGRHLWRSPGLRLDLGGIAKGWTCDQAVERELATVVSAGGDLRSADPETVASVTDDDGNVVVKVHVGNGALASSSIGKRRWRVAGSEVSHIIDPRTMRPVHTPVRGATVQAGTAVDAEAGAKAVLLLGEDGLAWASRQTWIDAALVIWDDGSIYGTPGLKVAA